MNFRGFFWILLAVPNGPADILLVLWILLPNGLTDIGDLDPATQWADGYRCCGSRYPMGRWIGAVDPGTQWAGGQVS
jgi:hypothetical protein